MKFTEVLRLPGEIKILADQRNWVLEVGNKNHRNYFSALDDLCDELLEIRLNIEAARAKRVKTDIRSLREAVRDAREEVRNDIERLKNVWIRADREREQHFKRRGGL